MPPPAVRLTCSSRLLWHRCHGLQDEARAQLDGYLTALKRTATLSCQVDSDCTLLSSPSLDCVVPCGQLLWTTDVPTLTAETANLCDDYFAAGCPKETPPCPGGYAICEQGGCMIGARRVPPDGGSDSQAVDVPPALDVNVATPDAPICDQLAATAQAQATAYIQGNYSLACQVDSDCSFLQARASSCFAVCGNFVVRSADLPAVETATAGYCTDYFAAGCPERVPPCPYARPVCDRGTCVHGPLPSGPADATVEAGADQPGPG
jgi:hypothetical protein